MPTNFPKSRHRRSFILTPEGLKKLQDKIYELEAKTQVRYTPRKISDQARLRVSQGLHSDTVRKIFSRQIGVDKRSIELLFNTLELELDKNDYTEADLEQKSFNTDPAMETDARLQPKSKFANTRQDLNEIVRVSFFYGRTEELATLEQWIVDDSCRLVALLGMGGIGKTALSVKLAEQIQDSFEYVIWRSLRNAPPLKEILAHLIEFLSDQQENTLSDNVDSRLSLLMDYLSRHRCLLVLDNVESILQGGERAGHYREGYEDYDQLLRWVAEVPHQSCLVLTSREKPREISLLEGETLPVRSLEIHGLRVIEAQEILRAKTLALTESEMQTLVEHYAGNPLALQIASATIKELFETNVSEFLRQGIVVFGDINELLDQQFDRLSDLETEIMYWLAINREPVSLAELREDIVPPMSPSQVLAALESLKHRSLIEQSVEVFTLQSIVMEYVTERLIEDVCEEISAEELINFNRYALLKAQARDYVRNAQVRLIIQPVMARLFSIFRSEVNIEKQLVQVLTVLRSQSKIELGYAGGNMLNLLCQLKGDLSSYNFSHLIIWQAHLQSVNLHDISFAHSDLSKSVFNESFGGIWSVAFSPDGQLIATGVKYGNDGP